MAKNQNVPALRSYLHKPVVRRSFIHDVNFSLHIIELHIFTLIYEDQLQGVRTFSQYSVNPTQEPVGVEHLSMRVLPQWGDPVG